MHATEAKSFSQWMKHIAREHEDQIQADIAAAAAAERRAKIRRICYSISTVILMSIAIWHRAEIGRGIYALTLEKLQSKPAVTEGDDTELADADDPAAFRRNARKNVGGNLKAIQGVASERDRLLEEFSGK
jgi:hypothetical protein